MNATVFQMVYFRPMSDIKEEKKKSNAINVAVSVGVYATAIAFAVTSILIPVALWKYIVS